MVLVNNYWQIWLVNASRSDDKLNILVYMHTYSRSITKWIGQQIHAGHICQSKSNIHPITTTTTVLLYQVYQEELNTIVQNGHTCRIMMKYCILHIAVTGRRHHICRLWMSCHLNILQLNWCLGNRSIIKCSSFIALAALGEKAFRQQPNRQNIRNVFQTKFFIVANAYT